MSIERIENLEKGQQQLTEGFYEHDKKIAVITNNQDRQQETLDKISNNTAWLVKLVASFIIGAILTAVFGVPSF